MAIGNQFRTVILLGLLTALFLWVGDMVGGPSGLTIAIIFAVVMNFGAYWFSDKIVLRMYRAKEVKESDERELFSMVREVSDLAKIPMPKVYVIDAESFVQNSLNNIPASLACAEVWHCCVFAVELFSFFI